MESPSRKGLELLNADVLVVICDLIAKERRGIVDDYPPPTKLDPGSRLRPRQLLSPLESFSMVNHDLRTFVAPFLFRKISMNDDWSCTSRALKALLDNAYMLEHVRFFKYKGFDKRFSGPLAWSGDTPRLIEVFRSMPHVETIYLELPSAYASRLGAQYRKAALSLPTVRKLVLGPLSDALVSHCPNVTAVSSSRTFNKRYVVNLPTRQHVARAHRGAGLTIPSNFHSEFDDTAWHINLLVRSAATLGDNLTYFEMNLPWTIEDLSFVADAMPRLRRLALACNEFSTYNDSAVSFISVLPRFECLEMLAMASTALQLGRLVSGGGSVGFSAGLLLLPLTAAPQRELVRTEFARRVFEVCRSLVAFYAGSACRAEAERDASAEGGVGKVIWTTQHRLEFMSDYW